MQWRRRWAYVERPPRPKVRKLSPDENKQHLAEMTGEIARSPILTAFGLQVRPLRGRFYLERPTPDGVDVWGRITPLDNDLLLEKERRSWSEIDQGSARKLIRTIAGDTEGTFHGLGALNRSLQKAGKGLTRQRMTVARNRFRYADSKKECTAQEALFHYFGLPVEVISEPSDWYSYHREPEIQEFSDDRTQVLVRFTAMSMTESFGSTCLYAQREGEWSAFPIRPNASKDLATAHAWLVKRKWEAWC